MSVLIAPSRRELVRTAARRSLRRRQIVGRIVLGLCVLAVVAAVAPLVALVYFTISRGVGTLSWAFLTHAPTPPFIPGGGISTAITGTAEIVASPSSSPSPPRCSPPSSSSSGAGSSPPRCVSAPTC